MPSNLQTIHITLGIVVALLTIAGIVFGWFRKVWDWAYSLFKNKGSNGLVKVPKKTMILLPVSRPNAFWWHMGSTKKKPSMQIVGDLNVTNISEYGVYIRGVKLRKPKAVGHATVRAQGSNLHSSNHKIPSRAISDLRFTFLVQPPVCKEGETFKGDVAIIDQFGNEHWLKKLEFPCH